MLIHGHTEECIRKYGAAEQRREDYRRRYPDYCKACGGSGVVLNNFKQNINKYKNISLKVYY